MLGITSAMLDTIPIASYGPPAFAASHEGPHRESLRRRSSGALNLPSPDNGDLRDLGERIDEVRRREESRKLRPPATPAGIVLRFGTELLAAIIAGVAIGWGLDWVFGTRPVFILVMFFFGAAAGIRNVIALAKEINEQAMRDLAGKPVPPTVADDEED